MLCCLTPEEKALKQRDKEINKKLKEKAKQRDSVTNLLLLGTGDSGKSTIFKQMKPLSRQTLGEAEEYKRAIISNILDSMWRMTVSMYKFGITLSNPALMGAIQQFRDPNDEEFRLTPEVAIQIKQIWKDPNMQKVYERRSEYQLNDNTSYFLNKADIIAQPGYQPTEEDILKVKIVSRSIQYIDFTFEGVKFHMTDVGGQRKERSKWIDCFSDVKAVIFVVASSEYDLALAEDPTVNRMRESLNLFNQILRYQCFNETGFILFLNKIDIFKEKIKVKPITIAFPDYHGKQEFEESLIFIRDRFLMMNKFPERTIYPHFTCATDTNNVRKVFVCVKDIILKSSLKQVGIDYIK